MVGFVVVVAADAVDVAVVALDVVVSIAVAFYPSLLPCGCRRYCW